MQLFVADFPAAGVGVGDVLPSILPTHTVPELLHVFDKLLLRSAAAHTEIDGIDELKLPALALDRRAILPTVHSAAVF